MHSFRRSATFLLAAGRRTRAHRVQPHQRRRRRTQTNASHLDERRHRHRFVGPVCTQERVSFRVSRRWHLRACRVIPAATASVV